MRKRIHRRSGPSERLRREVEAWAAKIGVIPKQITVQPMTKKWASCTPTGRIYLSSDLSREVPGFRDVVIVHELLHLRIQNHGKLFKGLMGAFLPGWERRSAGRVRKVCR